MTCAHNQLVVDGVTVALCPECVRQERDAARAEVAALREAYRVSQDSLGRLLDQADAEARDLAAARALLARLASAFGAHESYLRCDAWAANDGALVDEARAFLDTRREYTLETHLATSPSARDAGLSTEDEAWLNAQEKRLGLGARDEAPRVCKHGTDLADTRLGCRRCAYESRGQTGRIPPARDEVP